MPALETQTLSLDRLRDFAERVFRRYDVPEADARLAAEVLTAADRRGVDSHGVARLRVYAALLEAGRINPRPRIEVVRETASTATVDGDNGLGLIVGPWANRLAMEKAEAAGSGWVSVRHTNHFGIAGYYVLEALERDLIGWAMTNATRRVAPLYGGEAMLGTNPIAIAFPGLEEPPVVIDMATSAAAYGKVEIARRLRQPVPLGWIIDADGFETTDPIAAFEGGALLPLGSDAQRGGHKGYCLATLVDMLSAVLSGANWGPFVPPFALDLAPPGERVGKGIGHFFGALRIDGFTDPEAFKGRVDAWIRTFRSTRPSPGTAGPLVPGDPEREAEAVRTRDGVPLLRSVVDDLEAVGRRTGLSL